jgi:hypothetical protein
MRRAPPCLEPHFFARQAGCLEWESRLSLDKSQNYEGACTFVHESRVFQNRSLVLFSGTQPRDYEPVGYKAVGF